MNVEKENIKTDEIEFEKLDKQIEKDEQDKKEVDNKNKNNKNNVILDWTKSIIIAVVLALVIKAFIFEPTKIQGSSMTNTLHNNDRVLINKIIMKFRPLNRGDIIVMKYDDQKDFIKRIVGLPGEYIQLIDGKVFINGKQYIEKYIRGDYTQARNGVEWKLGKDEYFVMGDNRTPGGSTDSRIFGPIKLERIKGVANFRFYPFDGNFGLVN